MRAEIVPDASRMRDHWWWREDWQPGSRHLQWYLTFEDAEPLHRLTTAMHKALAPFPALEAVALPWLHLTLAGFGSTTAVGEDQVRDVINAAHERLGAQPDLALTFAAAVVYAESVVLTPQPGPELPSLQRVLEESGRAVLGREAPGITVPFAPHLSVAYAAGDVDGRAVREALEEVDAEPVLVRPTLSLVEVTRDDHQYTWRLVSAFPL